MLTRVACTSDDDCPECGGCEVCGTCTCHLGGIADKSPTSSTTPKEEKEKQE